MTEILQAPDRFCAAVGRFKNDLRLQGLHQPALAGNTEFCVKITADAGNDMYCVVHGLRLLLHQKAAGNVRLHIPG